MPKESSIARVCDIITKYSVYVSVFLIPIFFLPWTADVLDFNKQTLLLLLVFVGVLSWMIKILISGKVEFNPSKLYIAVAVFLLAGILSTIFSLYRYGSFWGWPQLTSESALSLILVSLLYLLVSSAFSKKDIYTSAVILSLSAMIAEIIGILQLLGLFIIPFNFAKSYSFNTVGSSGTVGMFAAIMLPLQIILLVLAKSWHKLLFAFEILCLFVILFLINYSIVWWVVALGSTAIIIVGIIKRKIFDVRRTALPIFFLVVSLFFIIFRPQIGWIPQRANEIFIFQKDSFKISLQELKQNPILGSGPGTFAFDFSKYKNPSLNQSSLQGITLAKATTEVINNLATIGILGLAAFLALLAFSIYIGAKFLFFEKFDKKAEDKEIGTTYFILTMGLFSVLVAETLAFFLYNSNIVLNFIYFFTIAGLAVLTVKEKKTYTLKSSSLITFAITFAFILFFVFILGVAIFDGQRYVAEVNYFMGLKELQAGKIDQGVKSLESAASMNSSSDLYFRQLSQAYILSLQNEIKNNGSATPSQPELQKIQTLAANAVNAGKIATDLSPKNFNDWSSRGYIYENLVGIISNASDWAIKSYDQALLLDPNDANLLIQRGNASFAAALKLPQDSQSQNQKNQLLTQAKGFLEESTALSPNYSDALYYLGLVYDSLGQKDKAIQQFTKVLQLNPNNASVQNILNNLNAGKPALQTQTPEAATPSKTSTQK